MLKQLLKRIITFFITVLARLVLKKYKPKIIAVTGSVGKTSTKDAIYTALASSFYIRKSEKSFNSDIGIPLTVLGCPNAWNNIGKWLKNFFEGFLLIILRNHYPKWLVLEVGADRPDDIQKIARWVKPDIVVLTNFPDVPVHVEYFKAPEALIEEKLSLVAALKEEGILIINADDRRMRKISIARQRVISYGFDENADISASNGIYLYKDGAITGMSFRINHNGKSVPVKTEGFIGRQHIYPYLAALAVGIGERINILSMVEALKSHVAPPGRMRLIEGINQSIIIDDSYNSSPAAAEEALAVLKKVETKGKKIAVLGDMLELGSYSAEAHRGIGEKVAESADVLVAVGIRARDIGEGAHKAKMYKKKIVECNDAFEAGDKIEWLISAGDVVLVKGSQSMRMERVVEKIMKEQKRKEELLVRQDDEWLSRP